MQTNIDEILNILDDTQGLSDYDKFMRIKDRLTITTIQRVFKFSYPKAKKIIDDLLKVKAIKQEQNYYVVCNKDKYIMFINQFLKI